MKADDPKIIEINHKGTPHRWNNCVPVLMDHESGRVVDHEVMTIIRRIFRSLRADERIKFHQFSCLGVSTPVHMAVIEKINHKLVAAGLDLE